MPTEENAHFGKKHIPCQAVISFSTDGRLKPLYFKPEPSATATALFYATEEDAGEPVKVYNLKKADTREMSFHYYYCEIMIGEMVKTVVLIYRVREMTWSVEV